MPSHFFPDLATVCHEFCKIKFRWVVPEMNLHSSEAVGLNSWSSWKWTTTSNKKNMVNECNYKALQMWLGADTHEQHGGTAYQSTVKLERSSYTVGVDSANQIAQNNSHLDLHWCTWTYSSTHSSVYTDQQWAWHINLGTVETVWKV